MSEILEKIDRKENIPTLRFKEFKGEWNSCNLGDITRYTKGYAFKSVDYQDKGVRIVRVSDLTADRINGNNNKLYIDKEKAILYHKYKLKTGNIVITTVGSKPEMIESAVGRGIYIHNDNEGLLNQNMLKFENIKGVDNGYVIGLINSKRYQHYMKAIARGNANQANITVKELLQYKLAIPTFPEQQKIASFLTTIDEKIQQLTRKKELLERYKKGVMQQLFSGELRFKDEDGKNYPEWEVKRLGDIGEISKIKNRRNEIKFVLTNSAIQGIVSQLEYFDKDIANQNNLEGYYIVEINDFVYNPRISATAPVGPIKRNKLEQGVMSPLYSILRFRERNLNFLEQYFNTTHWHKYMKSIANYGVRFDRMNITNSDLLKMPIPWPFLEEQQKIANFLLSINKKIELVTKELKSSQSFKKGLLQQMFV